MTSKGDYWVLRGLKRIESDPCPSGQAGLPGDKERELRVGKRLLSREHAVKRALIGVYLGSGMNGLWV